MLDLFVSNINSFQTKKSLTFLSNAGVLSKGVLIDYGCSFFSEIKPDT